MTDNIHLKENARATILKYFNQKINQHIGYIISDVIIIFGFFSNEYVLNMVLNNFLVYQIMIFLISILIVLIGRTFYWNTLLSAVIYIEPKMDILKNKNNFINGFIHASIDEISKRNTPNRKIGYRFRDTINSLKITWLLFIIISIFLYHVFFDC